MLLEQQDPKHTVSNNRKDLRGGKVFVDWSQNDEHKTTACAYSRRRRGAADRFDADDLEGVGDGACEQDPDLVNVEVPDVLKRVAAKGDLLARC